MVPLPWWRKTSPPHAHMTVLLLLLLMMMMIIIIIIIIITNIFCIIIDIHHHHHDDECYYCCDSFKLLSEESPIMIHSDVAVPSLPAFETYRGPSAMIPPKTCCKPSFISFIWHTSTCPLCSGWLRLTQVDLLQLEFVKGVSNLHYLAMFLGETADKPRFFFWANSQCRRKKWSPSSPWRRSVSTHPNRSLETWGIYGGTLWLDHWKIWKNLG